MLALRRLSNVPASLQNPRKIAYCIISFWIYALFTSVISSSPLPEGFNSLIVEKTSES
jgi:hypothetical protein